MVLSSPRGLTGVANSISWCLFKFHTREMILMWRMSILLHLCYDENLPILIHSPFVCRVWHCQIVGRRFPHKHKYEDHQLRMPAFFFLIAQLALPPYDAGLGHRNPSKVPFLSPFFSHCFFAILFWQFWEFQCVLCMFCILAVPTLIFSWTFCASICSEWQGFTYPWGYGQRVCEGKGKGMNFPTLHIPLPLRRVQGYTGSDFRRC